MNIPKIPQISNFDYMVTSKSNPYMSISSNELQYDLPVLSTTIPKTQTMTNISSSNQSEFSLSSSNNQADLSKNLRGLAKYTLVEKIGSGGQGAVYKALNKVNGKIVAVKILNIDSRSIGNASQELSTLEKISIPNCHPFLICYYDHYYDLLNRHLFIEMEYIEGLVLSQWAKNFTGPSLHNKLLLVIDDLCKALSFIHSQGIIHRDVKPENIIVTHDNIPKLIDFGLSCFPTPCYINLPCCKKNPGTLPYMSPETYSMQESYFASDIWSLGVTMFGIATGLYPFNFSRAKTLEEYSAIVLNSRPLTLTTPNEKLNTIVNSCLNPDPFTRITIPQIQAIIRS